VRAHRADPLPLEGLRERFLPERAFHGRQNSKFHYAVLAAAALQGRKPLKAGVDRFRVPALSR